MDKLKQALQEGSLVPFLGMGVFKETKATDGTQ